MCPNDILILFCAIIQSKMLPRGFHIRLQFLATIFGKKKKSFKKRWHSIQIENSEFNINYQLIGNFLIITNGLTVAWYIVYGNKFHTSSNPLTVPPLTKNEVIWVNALFYLAGLIGTVFLTMIGDVFGRKNTLMVLLVPQMVRYSHSILARFLFIKISLLLSIKYENSSPGC